MNWSEANPNAELAIEAWVDGELPDSDLRAFEARLAKDDDLQRRVRLAGEIRSGLRALPAERLPDAVTAHVLGAARQSARPPGILDALRRWFDLLTRLSWQPALATGVLAALLVISVRVGAPAEPAPNDPAVAQALEDVKWTLAFLSEVGAQAGRTVRDDVFEPHVVDPMQGAVNQVLANPIR